MDRHLQAVCKCLLVLADELCQGANEVVSILGLLVFHLLLGRTSAFHADVPVTELAEVVTDMFIGKGCERSGCAIRSQDCVKRA